MKTQKELEELISEACQKYQVGTPIMVDVDYDKLIETLKSEYPNSPLLKRAILEPTPKTRKRKLPILMASLEKVKSIEEIKDWIKSIEGEDLVYIITPKYDGCSICFNEERGEAITRGDGREGQDVSLHLKNINKDLLLFREDRLSFGEAIISKSNWEKYFKDKVNPRSKQPYKSARNTVAGLLNNEEVQLEFKYVDYVPYGIGDGLSDKNSQLSILGNMSQNVVEVEDFTEEYLNKLYTFWSEDYQIDGLVIDVNYGEKRRELGRLPNGNPRYAIAYKNPAWSGSHETIVTEIEFNVSKQGKLKPVILIETVDIDGVEVNRVTGYNAKYLIDNNIAIGSEIEITRSGDVIPKHLKTLSFNQDKIFELIDELTVCPECLSQTIWDSTVTEMLCTNPKCRGIQLSKLEHFFTTIGVEEFARPSIEFLYDKGFDTIDKILNISKVELSSFEGWGEASANVILSQFNRLKTVGVPMAKLLHACDVFEGVLGEKTAQLIIDNTEIGEPYLVENLIKIKGVAVKTAEAFIKGIKEYEVRELYTLPILINQIESVKQEVKGDKFKGMKICFTGVRDKELEQLITEQGGEVVSGVSKTTTHLITANMEGSTLKSSKAVKARQLGVVIVDIESFKKW